MLLVEVVYRNAEPSLGLVALPGLFLRHVDGGARDPERPLEVGDALLGLAEVEPELDVGSRRLRGGVTEPTVLGLETVAAADVLVAVAEDERPFRVYPLLDG